MNKSLRSGILVAWVCALAALSGCGSGVETKTGSNGTGSSAPAVEPTVASGPLTGLGPLGVAGANLDDASTQVLLNASTDHTTANLLRLGMTANANGSAASQTGSGSAFGAVAQSQMIGPVTSIDYVNSRIGVLNLNVVYDGNTLLDGVDIIQQIALGTNVEVFGLRLPDNQGVLATRMMVHPEPLAQVEVLGPVTALGTSRVMVQGIPVNTVGAQVGNTGSAGVVYTSPPSTAAIAVGILVRAIGTFNPQDGSISASTIVVSLAPARPDGDLVFVEGFVKGLSGTTRIQLQDIDVDASNVPSVAASVVVGSRIRVRGKMLGGIAKAEAIDIISPMAQTEFVIEGQISALTSPVAFTVRGERVDASQAVYTGGAAANLAAGKRVRVKGFAGLGRVVAREIVFTD